ncbi:hypothetical protein ACA910_014744 [Epithemia clementina (nom. ined.)]
MPNLVIDWNSAPAAVLAFTGWTLLHTLFILGHRSVLINTGKMKANGFGPSRHEPQTTLYGRVCASHANCVENLTIFASIVLALTLMMGDGSSRGDSSANATTKEDGVDFLATLAWRTVYLRVGQSVMHCYSTSETVVTIRFLFFVGQLYCLGTMLYRAM